MISILIPVFNHDCSELLGSLHAQGESLRAAGGGDYEIIVGDDASTCTTTVEANRQACAKAHCNMTINAHNLGRAANRNAMARKARGTFLLFIDCDACVHDDAFLSRYAAATKGHDVLCGGIDAPHSMPSPDVALRFKYEHNAQRIRSLNYRRKNPYAHFSTFNFMIRRDVFMNIMFDENCHEYGYEDALFGLRLKQEGIAVEHINNPLEHTGLDTNAEFVDKCEQAMRTLKGLGDDIKQHSHVGAMAHKLERLHLVWAVKAWHRAFARHELANLRGKHPSLTLLKIYKLGYYCSISKTE